MVTVGDSAFPRFSWLLKNFPNVTRDPKEKLFNQKLRSARVVTENCYGMLKGRWRLIYKEAEMKKFNLKYVVMSCIMLHNLCIELHDPCEPRWKLEVEEMELADMKFNRLPSKKESNENARIICEWIWNHIE